MAHGAQMRLPPTAMPKDPGMEREEISIAGDEDGGDYYDFFLLGDGQLGIVVADVSGR